MSNTFLDAYVALMVGGMAFKVDDKVHVVGQTQSGATYDETGILMSIYQKPRGFSILTDGGNIIYYDFDRISVMEHIKGGRRWT